MAAVVPPPPGARSRRRSRARVPRGARPLRFRQARRALRPRADRPRRRVRGDRGARLPRRARRRRRRARPARARRARRRAISRKGIEDLEAVAKRHGAGGLGVARGAPATASAGRSPRRSPPKARCARSAATATCGCSWPTAGPRPARRWARSACVCATRSTSSRSTRRLRFLWVVDFPLLEQDPRRGAWTYMHHPFTRPRDEDLPHLESDPGRVRAWAYDLVLNGSEIGGGSLRIHREDVQSGCSRRSASARGGAPALRLLPRRPRLRHAAPRRHRLGPRPPGHAAGRRPQPARGDRLPEEPARLRSAHRGAGRRRTRPARGARPAPPAAGCEGGHGANAEGVGRRRRPPRRRVRQRRRRWPGCRRRRRKALAGTPKAVATPAAAEAATRDPARHPRPRRHDDRLQRPGRGRGVGGGRAAREQGVKLVACTGRRASGSRSASRQAPRPHNPHVFQSGAHIAFPDGETLKASSLKEAAALQLVRTRASSASCSRSTRRTTSTWSARRR
jgi:hypothetical protein